MSTAMMSTSVMNTSVMRTSGVDGSVMSRVGMTASAPRLRITRRGRSLLTGVVAVPLVIVAMVFALNGGQATASLDGSGVAAQYLTVSPGVSLWQLAGQLAPTADPREVIDEIVRLNQLTSTDVFAGQELAIPGRYSQK